LAVHASLAGKAPERSATGGGAVIVHESGCANKRNLSFSPHNKEKEYVPRAKAARTSVEKNKYPPDGQL
jgi:hypothetical protein